MKKSTKIAVKKDVLVTLPNGWTIKTLIYFQNFKN
jgi:hypothetical protein